MAAYRSCPVKTYLTKANAMRLNTPITMKTALARIMSDHQLDFVAFFDTVFPAYAEMSA